MKGRYFLAAIILFATAESIVSTAAALAPLRFGQEKPGGTLGEQAVALWPLFEKTASALDRSVSTAQRHDDSQLTRDELRAMITLKLRLRELATRQVLTRAELASISAETEAAQQLARDGRLLNRFLGFHQQANKLSATLTRIMAMMDATDTSSIRKDGEAGG